MVVSDLYEICKYSYKISVVRGKIKECPCREKLHEKPVPASGNYRSSFSSHKRMKDGCYRNAAEVKRPQFWTREKKLDPLRKEVSNKGMLQKT